MLGKERKSPVSVGVMLLMVVVIVSGFCYEIHNIKVKGKNVLAIFVR